MNKAEYAQVASEIHKRLGEFFDGYALLGFHPVSQELVVIMEFPDMKSGLAINCAMKTLQFQICPPQEPEQEAEKKGTE